MNEKGEGVSIEQTVEKPTKIEVVYTKPDNTQETIVLDFEKELADFLDFYKKTGIDLPADFEDSMRDIWNRNQKQIQKEIEGNGFDEVLLVPGKISLEELAKKMIMGYGYRTDGNFAEDGSFRSAMGINVYKSRILLVHKVKELTDRPELTQTLNIKAEDIDLLKALSLEDYLIFSRKFFEETGEHLDTTKETWTSTKSAGHLIYVKWGQKKELCVYSSNINYNNPNIGFRPSSCLE